MRIYLAGPDVFHPDARALGARKKAICAAQNLTGVFPLDETAATDRLLPRDTGLAIAAKDFRLARSCDGALVNLTPYLGPSMDTGTAVELGLFAGLGRPVIGYTTDPTDFETRVAPYLPGPDWLSERFTLCDNLMVEGAIAACSGQVFRPSRPLGFAALDTFEAAVRAMAAIARRNAT